MWNWYEYKVNSNGDTEYCKCKKCDSFPAMVITFQDDNEYGPYCEFHWILEINGKFYELEKKLDNEDWGSSPELEPKPTVLGICEKCSKEFYKKYILLSRNKLYYVCANCYDKYSTK